MPSLPLLWHFPISHFNEKVRWALDWKKIPHRREVLFVDYAPRAWWATRQMSLPILWLDGRAIADSTEIVAALETRYGEPSLYPLDAEALEQALLVEDDFDEGVAPAIRTLLIGEVLAQNPAAAVEILSTDMGSRLLPAVKRMAKVFGSFYRHRHQIDPETRALAPRQIETGLDRIERLRAGRPYLVGDEFSIADLTAASILGSIATPPELRHQPSESLFPESVLKLREQWSKHPSAEWVRDIYKSHRGPSAEVAAP